MSPEVLERPISSQQILRYEELLRSPNMAAYMDCIEGYILWGNEVPEGKKSAYFLPEIEKPTDIMAAMQVFKSIDIHFDQPENPAKMNVDVIGARKVRRDEVAGKFFNFEKPKPKRQSKLFREVFLAPEIAIKAACRGVDPDIFYPEQGESTKLARAICQLCKIKEECLEFALQNQELFGIWGGKSVRERKVILKARKKAAHSNGGTGGQHL